MGKAYIIGTGPGDEELLTIKAVKVLEKCTAVLYDRLVSNNILNYLKEDCEIYYCGKEPAASWHNLCEHIKKCHFTNYCSHASHERGSDNFQNAEIYRCRCSVKGNKKFWRSSEERKG